METLTIKISVHDVKMICSCTVDLVDQMPSVALVLNPLVHAIARSLGLRFLAVVIVELVLNING